MEENNQQQIQGLTKEQTENVLDEEKISNQEQWENKIDIHIDEFPTIIQILALDFTYKCKEDPKLNSFYTKVNWSIQES